MKQYVLDEPGMRPLQAQTPAPSPARGRWRWPVALAAVAALALIAARWFVDLHAEAPLRPAVVAPVPVYVAPVMPAPSERHVVAEPTSTTIAEPASAPIVSALEPPIPSRVTREKGRYIVDLHAAEVGPALSMLSEATHTTVTGSEVLVANAARITASFVAASPLEAWKGVFGNVASFAMSCGPSICAVRFVSLVADGAPAPSLTSTEQTPPQPASLAPPAAPIAPAGVESSEQPMADN